MPFNFPLIQEAKIQYGNLVLGELLTTPLGIVLWLLTFKLRQPGSLPKRMAGVLLLLLALLYILGWLGINGLVLGTGFGLL